VAEAVVDRLEVVQVDEQHGGGSRVPIRAVQGVSDAVGQQRPVGQAGERVLEGLFAGPPADQAGHAGGEDERGVQRGEAPRVGPGRGMVEHRVRIKDAHHAVVYGHVADRQQERKPVLVQRDDADHHEEVEVHLDQTVRQMHGDRRRSD
jgi:hypothetical protein